MNIHFIDERDRMKPVLIIILTIVFCITPSSAISGDEPPRIPIVIVENDWPPYYFRLPQTGFPGLARELLEICVQRTSYSPFFNFFPVNRMYAYLKSGEIDLAMFSYRADRDTMLHYGREPLFTSGYRPVVRAGESISITTLHDFDKLRLGHLAGLKYSPEFYQYIMERQKNGTLITSTIGDSPLKMLLEGIIDVFVDTESTVRWRARQLGVSAQVKILDFDIKTSDYFVTVSRQSPRITDPREFLDKLDSCIRELKENGKYEEIVGKYYQQKDTVQNP